MRILRLTLVVAAGLALGGCFQSTTVMKINADGSGMLEETVAITKAGLAQMRQFAALGGKSARGLSDPFSDEQVRGATTALGPGVTFVGSRPVQTAEGEGRAITYAFKDVSQLGASQQPPMPGAGPGGQGSARPQEVYFAMTRRPNGNAVLTIRLPEPKLPSTPGRGGIDGGSGDPTGTLPPQFPVGQLGMMTQMFAGARLAIAVEPHGRLVQSSSPFVEGQIVTLLDLDFEQLIKSDSALTRIGAVRSLEDAKVAMQGIPGLKVSLDREIAIEFTPAQ